MQIDKERLEKYLTQITAESLDIEKILQQSDEEILANSHFIKSCKYSLIVISEAIANTLQHILARNFHATVTGYTEVFVKAGQYKIISDDLLSKFQSFIGFRNMLVHQYWRVDDSLFLKNLRARIRNFKDFVKEIKNIL